LRVSGWNDSSVMPASRPLSSPYAAIRFARACGATWSRCLQRSPPVVVRSSPYGLKNALPAA
jgi:hypothetical protein